MAALLISTDRKKIFYGIDFVGGAVLSCCRFDVSSVAGLHVGGCRFGFFVYAVCL
jgi:hypothetical protein